MSEQKQKLDTLLVDKLFVSDLNEARVLIESGRVCVNGFVRENVNSRCTPKDKITLIRKKRFVSRGGSKLEAALEEFGLNPFGMTCLDIGASTGGFTDCLLQHGASKVYCVDVGYGILDWKLRSDDRVVVLERTNARYLTSKEVPEVIDLCVMDASFISLNLLISPVLQFFQQDVLIVVLVKPQFQLPPEKITKGGVVTDQGLQREAVEMVTQFALTLGLETGGVIPSPVRGAKGNQEYLVLLTGKVNHSP